MAINRTQFNEDIFRWQDKAACRDTDPDLFFPIGNTGPSLEQINSAKEVCASCIVRNQCLEFALVRNEDTGVWGGTSETERQAIKRHRRRSIN